MIKQILGGSTLFCFNLKGTMKDLTVWWVVDQQERQGFLDFFLKKFKKEKWRFGLKILEFVAVDLFIGGFRDGQRYYDKEIK